MNDIVTLPMLETFSALLLAHVLADFVFQTNWMVQHKRDIPVLALHITLVFALTALALGGGWQVAVMAAGLHLLIDAVKTYSPARFRDTAAAFLADQAAHLASIATLALLFPLTLSTGLWGAQSTQLAPLAILISGFILTTRAGGFMVAILTARFVPPPDPDGDAGLAEAGRMIGVLERCLIFLLIYVGQPAGIGFLIAAKSILRFEAGNKLQASEYVIIGTLASFTWALAIGYGTMALLEIAANTP